jgi:hypothetical protein
MKLSVSIVAIGVTMLSRTSALSQDHAFSVKDDIAMVRFSDPRTEPNVPGSDTASPSPNGRHIAVVTTRGLVDQDQIESRITIFDLDRVTSFLDLENGPPPQPRVVATVVSYPHREEPDAYAPVIKDLHWSKDGTSIYFKGENASGSYQIYEAKLDGTGFRSLTPASASVGRFDVGDHEIAYTASHPDVDSVPATDAINPDARVITGYRIHEIIFPGQLKGADPETFTLSVLDTLKDRGSARRVPNYTVREIPYLSYFFPFQLSPKGHHLIGLTPLEIVPDSWSQYDPVKGEEHLRLSNGRDPRLTRVDNTLRPQQYTLIDTLTGKQTELFDAPNARSLGYNLDNNRLAWTQDEERVLLTNTFLRLDSGHPEDRKKPCSVASVDLPSLVARCLFFEETAPKPGSTHVQDVAFGADNAIAVVLLRSGLEKQILQTFQLEDGEWRQTSSKELSAPVKALSDIKAVQSQAGKVKVFVKQSLNDPPTLWASDEKTGRQRQLWDPNPQFQHLRFGEASLYNWSDTSGRNWNGVLIKPTDYVPGKKYPLAIQMYSFVDGQFMTDGLYPTAFAARHLASAGFVVLQIKKKPDTLSEADPQIHLEGYRSAIESLVKMGLIDRSRVGVVGFSWTCWYVISTLIKDPTLFAAATIADGLDNSYMQYILFCVGSYPLQRQIERIRGTSPFGEGLKRWVEDAPGFHLDQVRTPLRIEAIGPSSVLQEWEIYSSLRLQSKPVDLIYFPRGTHIHQKPLERLESQQGNIDWLRFWLQDYEDPDPSKRRQYERWEGIRNASITAPH